MPDTDNDTDTDLGPQTKTSTDNTDRPNISTEHQKVGDARLPSDTLDRDRPAPKEEVARKSSLT